MHGLWTIKIEPDTIYLKPQIGFDPRTITCRYLVMLAEMETRYWTGSFNYSSHEIPTVDALEQKALKVLSDRNCVELYEIRCDKFCGWEGAYSKVCDISDSDEGPDDPQDRGGIYYCGLDHAGYKDMLVDCYYRYHDHLFVRCLLNEFGNAMRMYIPSDITSYIADIMYVIEEQDLIDQIQPYERLQSTMKALNI